MHSSNPTAPGQWECAVGITRSLEAGGRGHPSLLGQAVAWRQFPIPGYSPGKIITLPKFRLFTALFWKTCSLSFWKAWPHAVSTGSAPFPWQKQKYSPVPEQTENDQQCCLRFMKKTEETQSSRGDSQAFCSQAPQWVLDCQDVQKHFRKHPQCPSFISKCRLDWSRENKTHVHPYFH